MQAKNTNAVFISRFFGSASGFLDRDEVKDRVFNVIKNFDKVEESKINEEAKFVEDMGLDSLDVVEVVMAMEEEFVLEIPDSDAEKIFSAKDVIDFISTHPMAK